MLHSTKLSLFKATKTKKIKKNSLQVLPNFQVLGFLFSFYMSSLLRPKLNLIMPEKGLSSPPIISPPSPSSSLFFLRSSPLLLQWRFHVLTSLVVIGMVVVWSIDGCTIKSFLESWRFKQPDYLTMQQVVNSSHEPLSGFNLTHHQNTTKAAAFISSLPSYNMAKFNTSTQKNVTLEKFPTEEENVRWNNTQKTVASKDFLDGSLEKLPKDEGNVKLNSTQKNAALENLPKKGNTVEWISSGLDPNMTYGLLSRWLAPGGEPCKDSKTVEIEIPGLDGQDLVELHAGEVYEFGFQAVDELKRPKCLGGDYFETDLSGKAWKSRPLVKDFGNGSYLVSLQVHPDFSGDYNFTVILLFRHFEGLKLSPSRFVYNKVLRNVRVRFVDKGGIEMPGLKLCERSDFDRDVWLGRWTRHGKIDGCKISNDGRYRCLAPDYPCRSPWCSGSLGLLESNGWVYSSHCSFRLFSANSAWNCLKNRWIFFWGDSNHVDTIRNLLNFVLNLPEIKSVPRRFDMNFSNPANPSESVRITSIFNGHWNETQNYQGLNSLKDEGFRNLLKKYFLEDTVPDTIIMNSGLHDGVFWSNIRSFSGGADFTVSFWKEVLDSIRQRGLEVPQILYRTTIATGGYARALAFNPSKMEAFNWVLLEKLKRARLLSGVIDNFDLTYPWHFDNRCNDGVHYGRAPLKMKWRDGEIGHQYFVDLMLVHVLLNVLCAR